MRLINKNTKKFPLQKTIYCQQDVKKRKRNILYIFHYQRHNIDFSDNMEKRTCSIKSFIFPFYFFFTLHQRTLKCYKERCLILHGKKQKKNNLYINRRWLQIGGTAQQETYCHGEKKIKQHVVAGKDKGPLQSSNANFKKKLYN